MNVLNGRLSQLTLVLAAVTSLGLATATPARATSGDISWIDHYAYSVFSFAHRVVVRTDGRVFVTGLGTDPGYKYDYLTIAYSPEGRRLWSKAYDCPSGGCYDAAQDMAFGPDQHRVYVTGRSGANWATVAYRADGTRLWARRYDGPKSDDDWADAVAVSAPTGRIFVTGSSTGKGTREDITTIAYSPSGARLWIRRYDGPASASDGATELLVGRSGHRVYVIGSSTTSAGDQDVTIIAYRGDGTRVWTRRCSGSDGKDTVAGAVLRPDGRRIYLTGSSAGDFTTMAFRRDGTRLWTRRYDGPAGGSDTAADIAVSPDGQTVFVTGTSAGVQVDAVVTVAYAASGTGLWVERNEDYGDAITDSIAVSPDRGEVFVTANVSAGIAVLSYSPGGAAEWSTVYGVDGPRAEDSAVSPDGSSFIITGNDEDVYEHLVTIAYSVH